MQTPAIAWEGECRTHLPLAELIAASRAHAIIGATGTSETNKQKVRGKAILNECLPAGPIHGICCDGCVRNSNYCSTIEKSPWW